MNFLEDERFKGIEPFSGRCWLSSPTMHGEEQRYVDEAIRTNWVSTIGQNINEIEKGIARYVGCNYAVALSSGDRLVLGGCEYIFVALCGDSFRWDAPAEA